MGLYDDRLADLSEQRRSRRVAGRHEPGNRRARMQSPSPTSVQSLLFGRESGWTESKSKAWAKAHGYRYGEVDVTDQYIRIRQSDPKGSKVKRTIPFGRGIRAVVAREEDMAKAKEAPRRRRSRKKGATASKRPRRRRAARKAVTVAKPARRRRRKARKVQARRRRRTSHVMEVRAPRRRRRKTRRAARRVHAWRGNRAGHATAARKGWKRRKKTGTVRRRRRRVREVSEAAVTESPRRKRRRSRKVRATSVVKARRTRRRSGRRSRRMFASTGSSKMQMAEIAVALISGGLGFVLADGLDRFLATYDPAGAERPKDKFTSDGAGTLANTLNVASQPGLVRIAAGVGATALPAVAAMYTRGPLVRASLEGMTVGAGVSLFKTVWNGLLMPLLLPKDTSVGSLQKSYIARLYPAEAAAHINQAQNQTAVSSPGAGALSAPPADVGPFALAGDSPYADTAQALRRAAGVQDQFPSLQNVWGTGGPGSDYPTAAQALRKEAGVGETWLPGPPPGPGPGPQAKPGTDPSCGCIGDDLPFVGFMGDAPQEPMLFDPTQ